ncbi:MAG: hypothetical protein Cons2KO_14330 [Congregibacter sp.]
MSFLGELKRRNVIRVGGVYAVVGWLLVQVSASLEEAVGLPEWFDGFVVSCLAIGFPIALIFAWAFELTPEGVKRTSAVSEEDSITAQTASKLDAVLVVALLVFAAAMLIPRFLPSEGTTSLAAPSDNAVQESSAETAIAAIPEQVAEDAPPQASIAVLPFADLSPGGDQEYFADGISEELLNVFAKVKGMKVAGRTSSFAFKGRNEDLREIGNILRVAHILEGSVRTQGEKVRVTAQLIQVSDGYHLWSETYDGDLTDIFAVQDDIAQQILTAMRGQFDLEPEAQALPAARTDIAAYNLFLAARDQVATRDKAAMEDALTALNRALEIDPNYAPAYALRAQAVLLLSDRRSSYGDIPALEASQSAKVDVERALALDPDLAQAHAVRGLLLADVGRPDAAISSLRRAIELNPNSLDARNWLAIGLSDTGRIRAALDTFKELRDIDPLYFPGINNAFYWSNRIGDKAGAIEVAQQFLNHVNSDALRIDFEARLAGVNDELAQALRLASSIPEAQRSVPANEAMVLWYFLLGVDAVRQDGFEPIGGFQPEITATLGDPDAAVEEARREVEKNPDFIQLHGALIEALFQAGRDQAVLAHFTQEFNGNVDNFATRLRDRPLNDLPPFVAVAQAAKGSGDEALYARAMARWQETIATFMAGGDASQNIVMEEASYHAMSGKVEQSVEKCIEAYAISPIRFRTFISSREFSALRSDTRIRELVEKSTALVNEQRALLDLPALDSGPNTRPL